MMNMATAFGVLRIKVTELIRTQFLKSWIERDKLLKSINHQAVNFWQKSFVF